jgi:outer membrane scaffolding protein for murein synthesis (MipA/OmpV family)
MVSMRGLSIAAVAAAIAAPMPRTARPAELPLWEAGAGVAVISFPEYRGSDQRRTFVLPVPYLVYRGEYLKADRNSVRGQFLKNDRVELSVSVNGSIPVDSTDNAARKGMPDLDPTLELGPNLLLTILRKADRSLEIGVRMPARTVIATDFSHTHNVGWVFQPQINIDFRDTWLGEGWNVGFAAGPLYADRRYHNYFYGVAPAFATPQRPAFNAAGGYAGSQILGAVSKRFPSFWVGAFARWDTLAGAVFEASPLVRQKDSFAAGFAIAWILGKSQKTVEAEE